jgi:hypothetical protein
MPLHHRRKTVAMCGYSVSPTWRKRGRTAEERRGVENVRVPELPQLPATPRTEFYGERFLELALQRFEREGPWLFLSIHHHGWRAHRDMAALLLSDAELDGLSDDLRVHHAEHRAMAVLEELFVLLDQIWRVIAGIKSRRGRLPRPVTGGMARASCSTSTSPTTPRARTTRDGCVCSRRRPTGCLLAVEAGERTP